MLTTFPLGPSSKVLLDGSSLVGQEINPNYRMFQPLAEALQRRYGGTAHMCNRGVNGSTVGNVNARFLTDLSCAPFTTIIMDLGINERAVAPATTTADLTSLLAKVPDNVDTWIFTPYAWGEKWPTGSQGGFAGANDTVLDTVAAQIISLFAAKPRVMVTDLRTLMYVNKLPAANPANAQTGVWTWDGVHWNPPGRVTLWNIMQPLI